ncbi:histidine kinase [Zobellella endophytica]|uniref:Histidine kinase n=1 Tax=Zobellella endophytica TaxID=2116700 RepID=A0A2P7R8Y6_9GAMM|nr:CBS domain-containing protein [Zobellella endophytica]PSJ46650.1 histidine kinase [Zobellella endophytica]
MKTLPLYAVEATDHLVQPADFTGAYLDSPALSLLSDFKHSQPTMIDADTRAADALEMMQHDHTRLKLVVDDRDELLGLIQLEQLSHQAIIRQVAKGDARHDILVTDLMLPRDKIKSFSYQQLEHSTIADVIHTLQSSGEQYCLVIDRESHQIRSVISVQDIAQRLHMPLDIRKTPTLLNIVDTHSA